MNKLDTGELTGQQVFNGIYGEKEVSAAGRTPQILRHLRDQFGEDSAQWHDVQAAAYRRMLMGDTEKTYETNPRRLIDRINEVLTGNGEAVARTLGLNVDGLKDLQRTAETILRAAPKNKPHTSADLQEGIRKFVSRIPIVKDLLATSAERTIAQARAATSGVITPEMVGGKPPIPPSLLRTGLPPVAARSGPGMLQFYNWDQQRH